uniref:Uncharacterized protein n=1 Tax=viral metagenome TaxID=1070528 RepID=A0A6C0HFM9_9ZZZZ
MKFPIKREDLKGYELDKANGEIKEKKFQKKLDELVVGICTIFEYMFPACHKEKRFYYHLESLELDSIPLFDEKGFYVNKPGHTLNILISKLKEKFIGCDISVDILKTYLIIDWS